MIKKVLKEIWNIRWVIITLFMMISFIASTIQDFISKDYDSGFNNLMIVLLIIDVLLLLWSRAEAENLIDIQNEVIDSQDKLIKQNEKSIALRDDLIAKQSKWINQVTKSAKESAEKIGGIVND
jgi:competence protein ComGC